MIKTTKLSTDYTDYADKSYLRNLWIKALVVLVFAFPLSCSAQQVVDKMVATVNAGARTDLITYSDLMWQLALQPRTVLDNPTSQDLNRALRLLIDQRLILQEAEKIPTIVPTQKEVSDARDELARNFTSVTEFQERLQRVGLTSEKLNEIVEQRLKMEKYLDFRFRNFVVISQKEIADYYRDVYTPRVQARLPGRIVPPLEQVRDEIEKTLMEAKIESDTDAFLDQARERAEIVTLNPV
jgi:parvulin-like peptidyl-prolyl isomerase